MADGHRLSIAAVAPPEDAERRIDLAARLAVDIALWDQLGCLSPIAVFVVDPKPAHAAALGEALALALADAEKNWPRGSIDARAAHSIAQERSEAELRRAAGRAVAIHLSDSTAWTVIVEDGVDPRPAPLHRFVRVVPVADVESLLDAARPLGRQTPRGGRHRRIRGPQRKARDRARRARCLAGLRARRAAESAARLAPRGPRRAHSARALRGHRGHPLARATSRQRAIPGAASARPRYERGSPAREARIGPRYTRVEFHKYLESMGKPSIEDRFGPIFTGPTWSDIFERRNRERREAGAPGRGARPKRELHEPIPAATRV